MSTKAKIIIKYDEDVLCFYRNTDGYPDGTLPTLQKFLNLIKIGKIRDNVFQASGWLIVIGMEEDKKSFSKLMSENDKNDYDSWKVGTYEPINSDYEDVDYVYTIDLKMKEITFFKKWMG